jgi:hypothetical protein
LLCKYRLIKRFCLIDSLEPKLKNRSLFLCYLCSGWKWWMRMTQHVGVASCSFGI